jgi:hypothetical protein
LSGKLTGKVCVPCKALLAYCSERLRLVSSATCQPSFPNNWRTWLGLCSAQPWSWLSLQVTYQSQVGVAPPASKPTALVPKEPPDTVSVAPGCCPKALVPLLV